MKIVVLNGTPKTTASYLPGYLDKLKSGLENNGNQVKQFDLASLDVHYCIGCWSCWLKTPGLCVFRDATDSILSEIVQADLLIFAAPLRLGFIHSILKKSVERIIPLLLPYISIYKGECHHLTRYNKLPDIGVILEKEKDTDAQDLEIIRNTFERLQLNFRSKLKIFSTIDVSPKEVENEIVCN
jgi:multimeric flavodoxin WrbA